MKVFMKINPFVSLVVLHYKHPELTIKLLESLHDTTYKNYEIILVDNSEKKECEKYRMKKYIPRHANFSYLPQSKNLGYAGGMNRGIQKSNGDYVVLMNNDIILLGNWLEELVKVIEGNGSIGVISGMAIYDDGTIQKMGEVETNPFILRYKSLKKGEKDHGQYSEIVNVDVVSGSCWMVRKEVFDKIGLLDERFFIEWDEVDFCYRARKAGYVTVVNPKSKIYHVGSASINLKSYLFNFHYRKNRIAFILKNLSIPRKLVDIPLTIFGFILIGIIDLLKGNYHNSTKASIDAIMWNISHFKELI